MIILGIDPGTQITGYGLIEQNGSHAHAVDSGCLSTTRSQPMSERLSYLFGELEKLISHYHPDVVVIEQAFFAKNASSALKLGQCRGIAMLAAARAGLPVYEYSPRTIKQAVTGSGQASKEQIQKMVQILLKLPEAAAPDASDALAAALCHAQSHSIKNIASNPSRVSVRGGR